MRIGDAAAAAGTTPRALRFYEERGLLPPPARSTSGQRVYDLTDVIRIRAVRELLGLGLTIEDVRGFASRLDLFTETAKPRCSPAPTAPDGSTASPASAAVARRLAALDAEIDRLTRLRDRLAHAAGGGSAQ
ncbi:MerR family transcriptional regulator [Streptodolium elevatio]